MTANASPLRAIHIIPTVNEEASGPSYSVVRLCESLKAQGQEIALAALERAPMASPPVFLKTFRQGWGPQRLGRSPAMHRWLSAQARTHSVDLLHNHSLWMMPNIYPGSVARHNAIPLIVSPRGTLSPWAMRRGSSLKRLIWPLLQRPALDAAACFHATADSEYRDIRRLGFRQPVAIIPNGVDIPELIPRVPGAARTLLFLGRVHPIKGLDMLLPAWAAVQQRFPDWQLRIAGPDNGGYLRTIGRLARKLGLLRTEICGPFYGNDKRIAYAQAELFVLPSYSESFGMTVAESLAAGTPAIATKGAPWSGLETRAAGWWIDIGIDPLVACLEDALSRPQTSLGEMGLRGRAWIAAEYAWERVGHRMAATYRWVKSGGPACDWVIDN
jgi:glycosyltransferase involved in cell wall biosynthesis